MATNTGVWGIDVGQCGLKAVKLRQADESKVELVAFDYIEHPKILSQPDSEPDEIIKAALEKFVSRNDWQRDQFVIGVPGQQTFARFCKLPPVEAKKLPDLVKFEAAQQIPFSMDEVVWDYQVFQTKDSPDVEVGIFAMRRDLIKKYLDYFTQLSAAPVAIQTIPSALYNFCKWDGQGPEGGAAVVVDVGAQNTDLIVVEANSAWYRNIPLGGNNFTEALVKAFKLSFAKAENLKRTAADSKYARQVFQAMRPVFADLVAEIQRSLGFYSSTHRDVELKTVLACGNAFRLPGLQKYLENNLTLDGGVSKLEAFKKLAANTTSNAPQFTENVLSFGPAFGLALQGLGIAPVSANLLPPELARIAMWRRKQPWFMAAAACTLGAAAMPWLRFSLDSAALASSTVRDAGSQAGQIVKTAQRYQSEFAKAQGDTSGEKAKLDKLLELDNDRALVPMIYNLFHQALPEPDPLIASIRSAEDFKKKIASNPNYSRTRRKEFLVDTLVVKFVKDIDKYTPPDVLGGGLDRGGSGGMASSGFSGGGAAFGDFGGPRGGGGRMGDDGGRGPSGGGGSEVQTGDNAAATAPGFYVKFNGRLLYGAGQDNASEYITQQFYPELKRLFRQPGLGFFLPDEDPTSPNKQNLRDDLAPMRKHMPLGVSLTAGAETPGAKPSGNKPGEPEVHAIDPDPITGEERATDWTISIGFKLKLGEMPPPPAADPAAAAKAPGKP